MTTPLTINMPEGFSRWDSTEILKTEEDMQLYLDACFEEDDGDGKLIAHALGDIARARGMTQLAKATGLTREGLYIALSAKGNPSFATVIKVTRALGLRLHSSRINGAAQSY
jgi:probable addiction module antidote protein